MSDKLLPAPMKASEFVDTFIDEVRLCDFGDQVGLSTMQFAPQPDLPGQKIEELVSELTAANERGVAAHVSIDGAYVKRMTRIGNRDFPDFLPILSAKKRAERQMNIGAASLALSTLSDHGLLVEASPRPLERGYTPVLRQMGSLHALQTFATRHAKEAHVKRSDGTSLAWITSANFTDSDSTDPEPGSLQGMNNLAFEVHGHLARFVVKSMQDGFGRISGSERYVEDSVTVIHDINNSGEPARLPTILQETLAAIDPRRSEIIDDPTRTNPKTPTQIVLLSQYLPDGLLFSTLASMANGADVYVPTQPDYDYRKVSFPYNLHSYVEGRKLDGSNVSMITREVPSHVKALVVRYDDATAKIIAGTDNFTTHLQKFVRNEELALVIELNLKQEDDLEYFDHFINLLKTMREIDEDISQSLLS